MIYICKGCDGDFVFNGHDESWIHTIQGEGPYCRPCLEEIEAMEVPQIGLFRWLYNKLMGKEEEL